MKSPFKIFPVFVVAMIVFACNPDENNPKDLEKPIVSKVTLNNVELTDTTEAMLEEHNDLEITFTDNQELSESNINIHFAGGHSHEENAIITADDISGTPFSYGPIISELNGKNSIKSYHFEIPDSASLGDYHLEISVLDKSANKTTEIHTIEFGEVVHN
jgi:hypothetical protein